MYIVLFKSLLFEKLNISHLLLDFPQFFSTTPLPACLSIVFISCCLILFKCSCRLNILLALLAACTYVNPALCVKLWLFGLCGYRQSLFYVFFFLFLGFLLYSPSFLRFHFTEETLAAPQIK